MDSRVILTANNLRVFDHLVGWRSVDELKDKLKTDRRATEILLDALTALGLLKKKKDRYKNTPLSDRFLVSSSPYYQGNIIAHAENLWWSWSGLDDVLKTGRPNRTERWDLRAFILGMHDIASLRSEEVIKRLPLRRVKKALDLGGGPGTYSIELAKKGLEVTLFDRPEVLEIAERVINDTPYGNNIKLKPGDFMVDSFGRGYDLVFLSQVLHAYSERDNIRLLRRIRKALNPGGYVAVQEFYLNETRTSPLRGALFSVNMLVNTQGGRTYTSKEIRGWLKDVGFISIRTHRLGETALYIGKI